MLNSVCWKRSPGEAFINLFVYCLFFPLPGMTGALSSVNEGKPDIQI